MYRYKWKGANIITNINTTTTTTITTPPPLIDNVPLSQIYVHDNESKLEFKDTFPSPTTHYNYEEIALCVAMRMYLKSPSLFYTIEQFDHGFLNKQQYRCSLNDLDRVEFSLNKSIVRFLSNHLWQHTTDVADVIRYACRALKIPLYHIFRGTAEFMAYHKKSLRQACLSLSSLDLVPKNEGFELYETYLTRWTLFSLIHRATVVSPSHFIEFELRLNHFVISNKLKSPNMKVNVKIHIAMTDSFKNLYSLFNKNEKKKWSPVLERVSYHYHVINQIKYSYVILFNYFMKDLDPFYPAMVYENDTIDVVRRNDYEKPTVRENLHFHYYGNTGNYYQRLEKLTNKVECDYLYQIRRFSAAPFAGWRSPSPVDKFEMPKIEQMPTHKVQFFVPSIVIHVTTPTRVSKNDGMLNKRYAWQICKFNGLTSSGYSQRKDPSGHVYSMNIAGGESNGRTKLLVLFSAFFNRKYNSMIPNQQIHTNIQREQNNRRQLIWTYVSCSLSNQCKSDRNFFAGVTDLTHRAKLIEEYWPRYLKKISFPAVQRMSECKQNDDLLIHKGTVLTRISTVNSQITKSVLDMMAQTKKVADYCPELTELNYAMESEHMIQFPNFIIYVFKLLYYKHMDVEKVRRKLSPLLLSRRLYAQSANWCISLSNKTEELWKLSSIKSNVAGNDHKPIIRDNRELIKRFIERFKKIGDDNVERKGDDLPESLMNREIYRFKYIPDPSIYLLTASKEAFLTCPYYQYAFTLYKNFIDKFGGREKFKDTYVVFDIIEDYRKELNGEQPQQQQPKKKKQQLSDEDDEDEEDDDDDDSDYNFFSAAHH